MYMNMNFEVCTPHCLRKFCIRWATKCLISRPFFKSKLISMIWGVACPLAYENLHGKVFSPLMWEILHAWRDFFHWCWRFYMLGGRAGEIVSRRETPSQCGRVGSPENSPFFKGAPFWNLISQKRKQLRFSEVNYLNYTKTQFCMWQLHFP